MLCAQYCSACLPCHYTAPLMIFALFSGTHASLSCSAVGRDALIREALAALRTCTEAEKDLDTLNTVVGIVGRGEKFTILEGDVVAPFLVDLPTRPAAAAEEEEEEAAAPAPAAPASSEAMAVEGGDAPASAMEIS